MNMRTARRLLPLVVLALVACGSNDDPAGPGERPVLEVDAALVGTWVGPVEGPGAAGTMTMNLNADGSMSASITEPTFLPIESGTWGVSGNVFNAEGLNTEGTLVSFTAPRSTTVLDGTWIAGGTGTFRITKQ
jgi:hypothetical protein